MNSACQEKLPAPRSHTRPGGQCARSAGQLQAAWDQLWSELVSGLRHGHFSMTLRCQTSGGGVRDLILEAGKHYRFLIEKNELQS